MKAEIGGLDIDCPICGQGWTLMVMVRTSDTRTGTLELSLDADRFRAHVRTHAQATEASNAMTGHVDAAAGPARCFHGVPLAEPCEFCQRGTA